jgi:hypothetical protein
LAHPRVPGFQTAHQKLRRLTQDSYVLMEEVEKLFIPG